MSGVQIRQRPDRDHGVRRVGPLDRRLRRQRATDPAGDLPIHHICTDKNRISIAWGGPWTARFEALFDKAGMRLNDALNKIAIQGHKGPHPEAYHQAIFRRLESATSGLNGGSYRNALQAELQAIRQELQNTESILNQLLRKL